MTFSFTFYELADLANFYVADKQKSKELDFELLPYDDGIEIHVKKVKISFISLKARFFISLQQFRNGELTVVVHFKNMFYEILKKIVFSIVINLVKGKIKAEQNGADITQYVHFSSNHIRIELNKLLAAVTVPVEVDNIKRYTSGVEIEFTVKKMDLDQDDPKEIPESAGSA